MKKEEIKIGGTYTAKVSDRVVPVRIDAENRHGGWDATNLVTNKQVRIKSAQRLRWETSGKGGAASAKSEKANAETDAMPAAEMGKAKKASKAKAPKTPKADKPLSCLGAAVEILKSSKEPMACKAMIDAMSSEKLWVSDAPTPAATLYSAILREIQKKGKDSRFVKTERGHFTLNA